MKAADVHNEVLKARAGVLNALAVGAVGGGAIQALQAQNGFLFALFCGVGIALHFVASQLLETMKVSND